MLPLAVGLAGHGSRIVRRHEPLTARRWEAICIVGGAILLSVYLAALAPGLAVSTRIVTVLTILGTLTANAILIRRAQRDRHAR